MVLLIIILLALVLTISGFFFQAFLLHFTTKKLDVKNSQYKIAIKINIYNILLLIAIGIIPTMILISMNLEWLSRAIMLVIGFFVLHELLKKFYKTTLKKNIQIYTVYTILSVILTIAISLFIVIPIRYFIIQPFYVKGAAMEPTLQENEYMLIDEISYRFNDPKRGEIIVFRYPKDPQEYFIKRIVGLPGEKIQIKDGKVLIFNEQNPEGIAMSETYLLPDTNTYSNTEEIIDIEDDEYYVLGDNRNSSKDSRSFGTVNTSFIIGKHWISPLSR